MTFEQDLFLKQVEYLVEAKKLYLDEIQKIERTFLLATGAVMAFLCTDAVASIDGAFYPYLWIIPCFITGYAIAKISSLKASLIDIADFEIAQVEPLVGDALPKWETSLKTLPSLRGRAKHKWSLEDSFWWILLVVNVMVAAGQIYFGPVFQSP